VAAVFRDNCAFGQSTIPVKSYVSSCAAQFILPTAAIRARETGIDSIHRYAIPQLNFAHVCADFQNFARKFMSDYKRDGPAGTRMRFLRNVKRPVHIFVEVCMAQCGAIHAETDLIATQFQLFWKVL
jgi:hypothetical protein